MQPVLLVDPDRNFRQALAIACRLDGVSIETASSVDEALRIFGRSGYRCCVVDCILPGTEQLITQLSKRAVPVILTSTRTDFLSEVAKRYPGVPTLEKPFDATALEARLSDQRPDAP